AMKPMIIRIKGKKYRIMPAGVALIVAALLAVIVLIAVLISNHKKEAEPEETAEATAEVEDYDASAGVLDKKEYDGTVLEETEDAGIEYVNSTLFLGDSNTARFLKEIYPETKKTYVSRENSIGVVGMGIDAISSLACMDFATGRMTMPQSVKILQPERVIITMGTNNLYGTSTDASSFIERYVTGIRAIEKAYPSVDIIVNSIPPVAKNTTYTNVSMKQIDAYNKAIAKMCQDNNWKYLDSSEALKDEKTGYAKDGYMSTVDGLHFSNKGIEALFKYIRTHSWITEDDRPKPLAAIPAVIGVPDGLIRTDPLTNEEFTSDPSVIEETAAPSATPEETETPTPTPTSTPTPTPVSCSAPYVLDASSGKCVPCSDGYVYSNGSCVVQQTTQPDQTDTSSTDTSSDQNSGQTQTDTTTPTDNTQNTEPTDQSGDTTVPDNTNTGTDQSSGDTSTENPG
ncbi:MAG: hypothetical protein J6S26_06115, partial [Solobacterium sp.]|nr:hypothetical protein [Solobacterium sp.]